MTGLGSEQKYSYQIEQDGSTTVRIAAGSPLGEVVRRLVADWSHRTVVGAVQQLPANRAADMATRVEEWLVRQILAECVENRLVPLSLPRPQWLLVPYERGLLTTTVSLEEARRLAADTARFVPGVCVAPALSTAVCYVEAVAIAEFLAPACPPSTTSPAGSNTIATTTTRSTSDRP